MSPQDQVSECGSLGLGPGWELQAGTRCPGVARDRVWLGTSKAPDSPAPWEDLQIV